MPRPRQCLHRDIDHVGNAVHRHAAAAARDARVGTLRDQPRAGGGGDAMRVLQCIGAHGLAAEHDQRRLAAAQDLGGIARSAPGSDCGFGGTGTGSAITPPSSQDVSDGRISVAIWPGWVRAACTATAASAPTVADEEAVRTQAEAPRAQPSVSAVSGASLRAVIGRLIADDVDDRRLRAARVVQIGEAVGETWPAMQQRRCRLAGHAGIAIGRAGHHALEQAKDAAHAGHAVERGDEVHLGCAGIGEARIDAALQQSMDEAFGAVHGQVLSGDESAATLREGSTGGNRPASRRSGTRGEPDL